MQQRIRTRVGCGKDSAFIHGALQMFGLHFWGAVMLSIFMNNLWMILILNTDLQCSRRQKKCMGKLLEYNADVNICNNEGLTAVSGL